MGPLSPNTSKEDTSSFVDSSLDEEPSAEKETHEDRLRPETSNPVGSGRLPSKPWKRASVDAKGVEEGGEGSPARVYEEGEAVPGGSQMSPRFEDESAESDLSSDRDREGNRPRSARRSSAVPGRGGGRRAGSYGGYPEKQDLKMRLGGELFPPEILDDLSSTRCSTSRGAERTTTGSAASSSRCGSLFSEFSGLAQDPTSLVRSSRSRRRTTQVSNRLNNDASAPPRVSAGILSGRGKQEEPEDRRLSCHADARPSTCTVETETSPFADSHCEEEYSVVPRKEGRHEGGEGEEEPPGSRRCGGFERERDSLCIRRRSTSASESISSCPTPSRGESFEKPEFALSPALSQESQLRAGEDEEQQGERVSGFSPRHQTSEFASRVDLRTRRQLRVEMCSRRDYSDATGRAEEASSVTGRERRGGRVPEHYYASRKHSRPGRRTTERDTPSSISEAPGVENAVPKAMRRDFTTLKETTRGRRKKKLDSSAVSMRPVSFEVSASTWRGSGEAPAASEEGVRQQQTVRRHREVVETIGARHEEKPDGRLPSTEVSSRERTGEADKMEAASSARKGKDSFLQRIEESRHKIRRHFANGRRTPSPGSRQAEREGGRLETRTSDAHVSGLRSEDACPCVAVAGQLRRHTTTAAASNRDLPENRPRLRSDSQSFDCGGWSSTEVDTSPVPEAPSMGSGKDGTKPTLYRTASEQQGRADIRQCDVTPVGVGSRPRIRAATRKAGDESTRNETGGATWKDASTGRSQRPSTNAQRSLLRTSEPLWDCDTSEPSTEDLSRGEGWSAERAGRIVPHALTSVSTEESPSASDGSLSDGRAGHCDTTQSKTEFCTGRLTPPQTTKYSREDRRQSSRDEAGTFPPWTTGRQASLSRRAVSPTGKMQERDTQACGRRQIFSSSPTSGGRTSAFPASEDTTSGYYRHGIHRTRETRNSLDRKHAGDSTDDFTEMGPRSPHSPYRHDLAGRRTPTAKGRQRGDRELKDTLDSQPGCHDVLPVDPELAGSTVVSAYGARQGRGNERPRRFDNCLRSQTERCHREKLDISPRISSSRPVSRAAAVERGSPRRHAQTRAVRLRRQGRRTADLSVGSRDSAWSEEGSAAPPRHTHCLENSKNVEQNRGKRQDPSAFPRTTRERNESSPASLKEQTGCTSCAPNQKRERGDRRRKVEEKKLETPLPSPLARVRNMQCNLETMIAQLKERHEYLDNHNVPSFPPPPPSVEEQVHLQGNGAKFCQDVFFTASGLPAYTQSVLTPRTAVTAPPATEIPGPACCLHRWWKQGGAQDEIPSPACRAAPAGTRGGGGIVTPVFHGGATSRPLAPSHPPRVTGGPGYKALSVPFCYESFQVSQGCRRCGQNMPYAKGPLPGVSSPASAARGDSGAYKDALLLQLLQAAQRLGAYDLVDGRSGAYTLNARKGCAEIMHTLGREPGDEACLPLQSWIASEGMKQPAEPARCPFAATSPCYPRAGVQTAAFVHPRTTGQTNWAYCPEGLETLPTGNAAGVPCLNRRAPFRCEPSSQQVDEEFDRCRQAFVVEPTCCQPLSPSLSSKAGAGRQEVGCPGPREGGGEGACTLTPRDRGMPPPTARFGGSTAADGTWPSPGATAGEAEWFGRGPSPDSRLDPRLSGGRPGGSAGSVPVRSGAVSSPFSPFGAVPTHTREFGGPSLLEGGGAFCPSASPSWSALAAERHRAPQSWEGLSSGDPRAVYPIPLSVHTDGPCSQSGYPSQPNTRGTMTGQEEVARWIQASGAAVPSHRLLQILQRRSNQRFPDVSGERRRAEAPPTGSTGSSVNPGGRPENRIFCPHLGRVPDLGAGAKLGQAEPPRVSAGADDRRHQRGGASMWSSSRGGCARSAGIGGSGLGPFGTNQLILAKLMDGLEAAQRQFQVAQGRRGSPHDRLGAPSESPPVSGGAQAVARGREIFDSLNARWRKFKASEGSPRSIHAAGCCSGSSSQGSSLYPSETRHTFDPPGQYYAVRGFHSPMGAGSFRGATSRDVRWGGRDPAGEPSAAFRFKINSLNQRVASVIGREYELLRDLQRARQKWCSETSALPARTRAAAGGVGALPGAAWSPSHQQAARSPVAPGHAAEPASRRSSRPPSVSPCGRRGHRLSSHSRELNSPGRSRLDAPPSASGAEDDPAAPACPERALSPSGARPWTAAYQQGSLFPSSPSRTLVEGKSSALVQGAGSDVGERRLVEERGRSVEPDRGASPRDLSPLLSSPMSRNYSGRQLGAGSSSQRAPFGLRDSERAQILLDIEHGSSQARPGTLTGHPAQPPLKPRERFGRSELKEREEKLRQRLTESETRAIAQEALRQAHCLDPILHTQEDELLESISEHLKRLNR